MGANISVLNCKTFDLTLHSIETLVGLSRKIILETIKGFDCNQFSQEHADDSRKLKEILPELLSQRGATIQVPDQIYWFHGTRVLQPDSLRAGLYPLDRQIDRIWDDLFGLAQRWVSQDQWNAFRGKVETTNSRVSHRLKFKEDQGPHAVLVRDVLIEPNRFESVDYLDCPEIIKDICGSFDEGFGKDLLKLFRDSSHPCIVTFLDDQPRNDAIGAATTYIWCIARNEDCLLCNTCYEANGRVISKTAIIDVEVMAKKTISGSG